MARPKKKRTPKTLFAKRLNFLIGDVNFFDFEKKYGLSNGQIGKFIDGAEPRLSAIEAIVKGTGCNAAWLLTGDGEPFKDELSAPFALAASPSNEVGKQASEPAQEPTKPPEADISPLDRLTTPPGSRCMQARPASKAEGEWWEDCRPTWELRGRGTATSASGVVVQDQGYADDTIAPPEGITLVEVVGDSMVPVLLPEQYAIIDKNREGFEVNGGIVVVVTMNEKGDWETRVKRCHRHSDEYRFSSINKESNPPFTIKKTLCRIWPVLGVWFAGKGKPPRED